MEWLTALVIELAGAVGFFALWFGLGVLDQPRSPAGSPRPHGGESHRRPEAGLVTYTSTAQSLRTFRHGLDAREVTS
jgi:hypothetical protein